MFMELVSSTTMSTLLMFILTVIVFYDVCTPSSFRNWAGEVSGRLLLARIYMIFITQVIKVRMWV